MRVPDYTIKSLKRAGKDCTAISFRFCPPALIREKLYRAGFRWDRESRVWIIQSVLEPFRIYSLIENWPDN